MVVSAVKRQDNLFWYERQLEYDAKIMMEQSILQPYLHEPIHSQEHYISKMQILQTFLYAHELIHSQEHYKAYVRKVDYNFCSLKKRPLQTFVVSKSGQYKPLY